MKKLLLLLVLCFIPAAYSQTSIDFTNFNSSSANGWMMANGSQPNKWVIGGAASYYDFFSRSGAYISNDMGTTYGYVDDTTAIVHFYKDIAINAVTKDMMLTFKLMCPGEEGNDYLTVHVVSSSITPQAGVELTEGLVGKSEYSGDDYWRGYSINLKRDLYTENFMRIVFTWKNDNNGSGTNPAALDEIRLSELSMNYDTFLPKINLPSGRYYGGSLMSGYSTYFVGGDVGGPPTQQAVEIDYGGQAGKDLPQITEAVRLNELTKMNGKIFSIGGFNTGATDPTDEIYSLDLKTFQWNPENPYPKKIFYHRVATYDWKAMYSIGGSDETNQLLNSVYYKLAAGINWEEATPLPGDGRADGGLAILDRENKIFYVGGFTNSFDFQRQVDSVFIGTIDTANPGVITWTTGTSFPGGPRARLRAFPWGRDKVIVVGGTDGGNFNTSTIFNDVWEYDLSEDQWTLLGNMPLALCAYMGGTERLSGGLWAMYFGGGIKPGPAISNTTYAYFDTVQTPTSVEDNETVVNDYFLSQNYPNPFNPTTKIKFTIPAVETRHASSQHAVSLKVFDILGNEVATLVNETKPSGTYEVEFNAEGLSSGVYFYQLKAGSFISTKKLLLLK